MPDEIHVGDGMTPEDFAARYAADVAAMDAAWDVACVTVWPVMRAAWQVANDDEFPPEDA